MIKKWILLISMVLSAFANAGELDATTKKVINYYKKDCEGSFDIGENGITHVQSTNLGVQVTVISTANMTCNGRPLGFCGSGGCSAHMVVKDRVYDTKGGVPSLLSKDPFVIGWWTSGYVCNVKGDQTISNSTNCMLAAVWDDYAKRLRYPHGNRQDSSLNLK